MSTMINRRRPLARFGALFAAICLASPGLAQTVRLIAPLEKGQVLRYDLGATIEVSSKPVTTEKLRQHARLRLTVADVDASGEATLRGTFESLDAAWSPGTGDEQTFSWKEGQELPDDAPALARTYGVLGATPVEVVVSRSGEIKSIDGPDKALEAGNAAKLTHPERALGALAYHSLPQTLSPIFTLDPDHKDRKPGDSWTATTTLPAVGGAAIKVSIVRTFKELNASEAAIVATITQSWQPAPGKADPTNPTGSPSDQTGPASERWDIKAGRLASRTLDSTVTWKLELGTTPPMDATRTLKTHLELKRLEPEPTKPSAPDEKP